MLVERHRSHQDLASKETYPSLPSSRTTSRNSSVQDPEEGDRDIKEMTETNPAHFDLGHVPSNFADHSISQPDLLDSQQATPTATSFARPIEGHLPQSPHDSRNSSPSRTNKGSNSHSILEAAASGAVVGGLATLTLDQSAPDDDPFLPSFPQDEQEEFQQGLEKMAPDMTRDPKMKREAGAPENLTGRIDETRFEKAPTQKNLDQWQNVVDPLPGVDNDSVNEAKGYISRDEFNLSRERSQVEAGEHDVNEEAADGNASRSFGKAAMLEDELNVKEQFALQKSKKGKKSKRKAGNSEITQESVAPSASLAATKLEDKAVGILSPEEARKIEEQDTQDAVDSWFSPATISKRSKKQKKKGVIEPNPELIRRSIDSDHTPENGFEPADSGGAQELEGLTTNVSSELVFDTKTPAAQSSEGVEENVLQPVNIPGRESIESQLERRQSKSKVKKSKKGRKGTSQYNDSQLASETPEDNSISDRPVDKSTKGRADLSLTDITAPSGIGIETPEQRKTEPLRDLQLSPNAIPLPTDDDLDLEGEDMTDLKKEKLADMHTFPASRSPRHVSVETQIKKDGELVEQPLEMPQNIEEGLDKASASQAYSIIEPVSLTPSRDIDLDKEALLPEDDQHAAAYECLQENVVDLVATPRGEDKKAGHIPEFDLESVKEPPKYGHKINTQGKIASPWPTASLDANDDPALGTSQLSGAQQPDGDLASQPTNVAPQMERGIAEDERKGPNSKKKAQEAGSDLIDDTALGAEIVADIDSPASREMLEREQLRKDGNEADEGHPLEGSKAVEDEWPTSNAKKKAKQNKKKQKLKAPHRIPESIDRKSGGEEPGLIEGEAVGSQALSLKPLADQKSKADESAALYAATSTSPEAAMLLESEVTHPSLAGAFDKISSSAPNFELRPQMASDDQHSKDNISRPSGLGITKQPAKDLGTDEMELNDQYRDKGDYEEEQALPVEEHDRSAMKTTERQDLELIGQDRKEKTLQGTPDSSAIIVDTVRDFAIVVDEESSTIPAEGKYTANKSSDDPYRDIKSTDNYAGREDSQGEIPMPDSSRGDGPMQEFTLREPGVQSDRKDGTRLKGLDNEPSTRKGRKDGKQKMNLLQGAVSDDQTASDVSPGMSEVLPKAELDYENLGFEMNASAVGDSDEAKAKENQHLDPSTSVEPIQAREATNDDCEAESETLQEFRPSKKKKKDKKNAKKTRAPTGEDEEAILLMEEKSFQEDTLLGEGGPGKSIKPDNEKDETIEAIPSRSKSKKDRKKQKNAQSLPWESEGAFARSQPEPQQQCDLERFSSETGGAEDMERRTNSKDPSSKDDYADPSSGISRDQDAEDQLPAEGQDNIIAATTFPGTIPKSPIESQVQAEAYGASISQSREAEEHSIPSHESNTKGNEKEQEAYSLTLGDFEPQRESEKASFVSTAENVQDQPFITPVSDTRERWSGAERPAEVVEPTDVVEPEDSNPVTQGYERISKNKPIAAVRDYVERSIEVVEEDPIQRKKSKKGKKSRKEKLKDVSSADPTSNSSSATEVVNDQDQCFNDQVQTFPDAVEEPPSSSRNVNTSTAFEYDRKEESSNIAEAQATSNMKAEDKIRDWPSQQGASQDAGQPKSQESFEVLKPAFPEPPNVTQNPAESELGQLSAEGEADDGHVEARGGSSRTETPISELLNPREQHDYNVQYARELGLLGVESPRSSRVDLTTSAVEAGALEHQGPPAMEFQYLDHSQLVEPEAQQNPASLVEAEAFEGDIGVPDNRRDRELENSEEPEQQSIMSPRSRSPDPLTSTAEHGLLGPQEQHEEGQGNTRDLQREDSEASQTLRKDPLTPVADIELLDAQEQQEYENAYAKELEKQLNPLEDGEQFSPTVDKTNDPSIARQSMDSLVSLPLEQRMPLAKPPPLEDILEESVSRPSSAQEAPSDPAEASSTFKPSKKTNKGKKSKNKQQPIIWEDDTATPPISDETDRHTDQPISLPVVSSSGNIGDDDVPPHYEEPVQHQQVEESSTSTTNDGEKKSQTTADDYFTIQPSTLAEQDIGRDPEDDEFRNALSTELKDSVQREYPEEAEQPSLDTNNHQESTEDGRAGVESTDRLNQPESASTPIEEQPSESLSYPVTKKNKKGKKSKRKPIERSPSPPAMISEHLTESSRSSDKAVRESTVEQRMSPEQLSGQDRSLEAEQVPSTDVKSEAAVGLASGSSLGAAASAIGGITRQESKKGCKKGKKNKKDKWVDFEEVPGLDSGITGNDIASPSAEKGQTLEQVSTTTEMEDKEDQTLRSPIPSTTSTAYEPVDSDIRHHVSQSPSPSYRDSAINISDSPLISEETPVYRSVRDSGYPETETSPTITTQKEDPSSLVEEDQGVSRAIPIEQENDQVYQTPERGRSPTGAHLNVSSDVDADYGVPSDKRRERPRRSRSYDSDDSGDSGFDIQRRRRQQAMNKSAKEPSPVSSTTKDRSSALFNSSPSAREEVVDGSREQYATSGNESVRPEPTWSFSQGDLPLLRSHSPSTTPVLSQAAESPLDQATYNKLEGHRGEPPESIFGGPVRPDDDLMSEPRSPAGSEARGRHRRLDTISEDGHKKPSLHAKDKRAISDVGSPEAGVKERRVHSPPATVRAESHLPSENLMSAESGPPNDNPRGSTDSDKRESRNQHSELSDLPSTIPALREGEHRTASAASMRSDNSIHAIIRTPDQVRSASRQSFRSSGTPPLRRVDRSASGDLRGASKLGEAKTRAKISEAEAELDPAIPISIPSSSTYDPVTDKGKSRADMADVYVSIRKKNEDVHETNTHLQEGWGDVRGQSPMSPTRPPSMRKRQSMQLLDLESRLDQLVSENRLLQTQKSTAERNLQDQTRDHSQQRHAYEEALQEHKMYLTQKDSELKELRETVEEWQHKVDQLTEINENLTASHALADGHDQRYRELEDEHVHLKERHTDLTTGMEALVQREVASHLAAKNSELHQLRIELESAKQQVRSLQLQLSASRESDDFIERDEDYFDGQCQSLCQHVQQWVLRFSKFSDMKACYHASEIRDEAKVDRMENAILDGTGVDMYLQDRVKRRDVFMAVVMTMIFDYIFTRYLFGMDREQRQKLKNLEKTLQDIGPVSAVCKWRATTLTLLMKREDFARQRATDTEAIVHEIFDTLATFLPPPSHLVSQIQDSLRKVITSAADLSIEMRTQRADYQMLPPLQPDYDTNGDLAQKVYFNSLTMNERSGATTSNQALQEQSAVVRMVLFPLVVKNEEDDEQIIVCPAQVLTASSKGKKTVRVMSVQGSTQGGRSEASFADMNMEGGMI